MAGKKYKLTFTLANGETQEIVFEVPPGETGPQGIQGETGPQGIQGIQGKPGDTPYIGANGNWWVSGADTGVSPNGVTIVQTTGNSKTAVMSQWAVSSVFANSVKDTAEGTVIEIDNISPLDHCVEVTFLHGKNMFNKETVTPKSGINYNTGDLYANAESFVSDYIKVKAGETYHLSWNTARYVVGFDSNKQYTAGLYSLYAHSGNTFTIPQGTEYIRFTAFTAEIDTIQMELGTVATEYNAFVSTVDVVSDNGKGEGGETITMNCGESATFASVYPLMRLQTTNGGVYLMAKYNMDTNSIYATEGEAWED